MAIVLFLFASVLGLMGATVQMLFGFGDFAAAFQTYALVSIGLPSVTLAAYSFTHT
ncbi:hypothetical protein N6L24_11415 [Cognatishimia sp. SS12]|uniref:hypothetical protein n=1 Tax=Cognatishimia sp. SS12 TaxID=2979465 RepID=UPI00232B7F0A|nr:hypothetical protein [Cognatishimia sp. SS12]MDC0738888.1 hypothetical protein [Cognatishimia sp. SS12]